MTNSPQKKTLMFSISVVLFASCWSTEAHGKRPRIAADAVDAEAAPRMAKPASAGRGLEKLHEAAFRASSFTVSVSLPTGGTQLVVDGTDKNPGTGHFDEWGMVEAVSGALAERVAMRHGNEWYVALRLPSGAIRIERWDVGRTNGAYFSGRRASVSGIGTAIDTPVLVVGVEGNQYIVPASRTRPSIIKTELTTLALNGQIAKMAVDPDARYLVMELASASTAHQLVQVALKASTAPSIAVGDVIPLWDFSSLPECPASNGITLLEHSTNGRAIVVGDSQTRIVLWDETNSGVFGTVEVLDTPEAWFGKYPPSNWSRVF